MVDMIRTKGKFSVVGACEGVGKDIPNESIAIALAHRATDVLNRPTTHGTPLRGGVRISEQQDSVLELDAICSLAIKETKTAC